MSNKKNYKITIVMGSQSDYSTMKYCIKVLQMLKIKHETKIVSAHRTPERMYKLISRNEASSLSEIRSNIYFNILRNIYQMNWLLIYLFGASPVIDKSIVQNNKDPFREFDKDSLFLPYATSLRMSEYGYSNIGIKEINVSVNSLDEYISDLRLATTTEEPEYLKHNKKKYSQLNSNILQIDRQEPYLPNTPSHYNSFCCFASFFFASFSCLIRLLTILANLTSCSVYQPGCSFASLMIFFAAFLSFNVLLILCPKDYLGFLPHLIVSYNQT